MNEVNSTDGNIPICVVYPCLWQCDKHRRRCKHSELKPDRYYYDAETGFYYLNSRYYDPEICRFINADGIDILLEDQGHLNEHNLYMYCWDDPIKHLDFTGEFPILAVDLVIGDGIVIDPPAISPSLISTTSNYISSVSSQISTLAASGIDIIIVETELFRIADRIETKSKKEAYERAKRAGKGKEPIHHPDGTNGKHGHYHPNVKQTQKLTPKMPCSHDHYFYADGLNIRNNGSGTLRMSLF